MNDAKVRRLDREPCGPRGILHRRELRDDRHLGGRRRGERHGYCNGGHADRDSGTPPGPHLSAPYGVPWRMPRPASRSVSVPSSRAI